MENHAVVYLDEWVIRCRCGFESKDEQAMVSHLLNAPGPAVPKSKPGRSAEGNRG